MAPGSNHTLDSGITPESFIYDGGHGLMAVISAVNESVRQINYGNNLIALLDT